MRCGDACQIVVERRQREEGRGYRRRTEGMAPVRDLSRDAVVAGLLAVAFLLCEAGREIVLGPVGADEYKAENRKNWEKGRKGRRESVSSSQDEKGRRARDDEALTLLLRWHS